MNSKKKLVLLTLVAMLVVTSTIIIINPIKKAKASNYYETTKCIIFDNTKLNWSEVYAYCWNADGDVEVIKFNQQDANTFYGTIFNPYLTDVLFKNTPGKDNWDKQTEDYKLPNGPNNFLFKPTKTEGKIEGKFTYSNYKYITINYKNDSITTPYVYYKIGDSNWSEGFGIKMQASTTKEGFYQVKFLVADKDELVCCFNNGTNNSTWDNNQNNYVLQTTNSFNTDYTIENGVVSK